MSDTMMRFFLAQFTALLLVSLSFATTSLAVERAKPISPIYAMSFQWVEDNGEKVAISKWKGAPVILAMAYTGCRKICVMTLRKLEEIQTIADQKQIPLEFIVVSLDPHTDNPASWTYYRKKHHLEHRRNWHFLTGNDASTSRLAYLMGMKYWQDTDHILHEFRILYLNANGHVDKILDWDNQDSATFFP